jgi:hypothetical protein
MTRRAIPMATLCLALLVATVAVARSFPANFSHETHTRLFPGTCTTCHVGPVDADSSFWPDASSCAACHDGEVEALVTYVPRTTPPVSNVRFVHQAHSRATSDSVSCVQCHTDGNPRGEVHVSRAVQCVNCHKPGRGHLDVGDLECATCHYPLAEARRLTPAAVGGFPVPLSHQVPSFRFEGHGNLAVLRQPSGGTVLNTSCATCHARNFCASCHVNASEVAAIQALAPDERSLVHKYTFMAPPSHAAPSFAASHRRDANRDPQSCATCHTRPSCTACHVEPLPRAVTVLPMPDTSRARGAVVHREPPASHTTAFREGHGNEASAAQRSCSTCHVRQDCLACHRAENGRASDYHPVTFIARHPAAAYARQVNCSDCHNTQQFCASCHRQAGLGGGNTLTGAQYHDGKAAFFVGHGQAARQSLESCVSCHAERDCTACHSAQGGRRFSPHGPGFDAERMRKRNPEMCVACHGRAVPTN